jgi:hypothetical protein
MTLRMYTYPPACVPSAAHAAVTVALAVVAAAQFGDVFCLRLLGQRMVFVFDPAMLTLFFKAPESSISFK